MIYSFKLHEYVKLKEIKKTLTTSKVERDNFKKRK